VVKIDAAGGRSGRSPSFAVIPFDFFNRSSDECRFGVDFFTVGRVHQEAQDVLLVRGPFLRSDIEGSKLTVVAHLKSKESGVWFPRCAQKRRQAARLGSFIACSYSAARS